MHFLHPLCPFSFTSSRVNIYQALTCILLFFTLLYPLRLCYSLAHPYFHVFKSSSVESKLKVLLSAFHVAADTDFWCLTYQDLFTFSSSLQQSSSTYFLNTIDFGFMIMSPLNHLYCIQHFFTLQYFFSFFFHVTSSFIYISTSTTFFSV